MDIHKPKPWHGWREFLKEYAIIVVGVLTALGAEQTVEWLHHGAELKETRAAIRAEIVDNLTTAQVLRIENHCLLGVTGKIAAWAQGGPRYTLAPTISPQFSFTIWDASQTSALSRMPLKEKYADAQFYAGLRNAQSLADVTRGQFIRLERLNGVRSLGAARASEVLEDMAEMRAVLFGSISYVGHLQQRAAPLGLRPQPLTGFARERLSAECAAGGMPAPDFDKPPL